MSARGIPEPRLPNPKCQFSLNVDHGPFLMKHTFEHVELSDATGSREQGEERLRDEIAWSQIDDEGRPKQHQLSHLRQVITRIGSVLLIIVGLAALPMLAKAQSLADSGNFPSIAASIAPAQRDLTYTRPTQTTKLRNYFFDAFGPYPIVGAALAAGISQADNAPPEWKQGAEGYGKRFGSAFGNRSGKHHDALCASRSLQGRHVVLPL